MEKHLERLGLLKLRLCLESVAKTKFTINRFFVDFGLDLCRFLGVLRLVFRIFFALDTGLKIDEISVV